MLTVHVYMKFANTPLKRTPVELVLDSDGQLVGPVATDREGLAHFDLAPASGKILVSSRERYHGRLEGEIDIALWSMTDADETSTGSPPHIGGGSTAYPNMTTRTLTVDGRSVLTDSEGYLVNPADWSEAFARQQARQEELELTNEHWEVIRFLREWYSEHGTQASVRDMIKHFRDIWGKDRGNNRYLHRLFPRGGPQKQGNRLSGLLRTKGEH